MPKTKDENSKWEKGKRGCKNVGNAVYGFGFIGAIIYFIQHASSFGDGLLGVLKAIVWPALLVYKALELWKM